MKNCAWDSFAHEILECTWGSQVVILCVFFLNYYKAHLVVERVDVAGGDAGRGASSIREARRRDKRHGVNGGEIVADVSVVAAIRQHARVAEHSLRNACSIGIV